MSEERDLEQELKEEKDRYEQQNQEAYDEVTKGNEELRRRQQQEEEEDTTTDKLESRGYKGNRESARQRQIRLRQKALADRDKEGSTVTRGPGQVFTGGKDTVEVPDRDMRTGQLIPNETELDQFGNPVRFAGGLLVEIFGNLGLDAAGIVADTFVPGAGTAIQAPGSAFFNWANQKIRGEKEINKGEMAAASAASLIPGLQPFRAATKAGRFYKSVLKGGTTGAIDVTGTKLGRGEEVTTTDLASGFVAGGLLGSVFGIKDGGEAYKALKNKINKGTAFVTDELNLDGTISRIVPEEPLEPATFLKSTSNTDSKGFGSLPEGGDLSEFLAVKRNRYDIADLMLRKADLSPDNPFYKRLQLSARAVPEFVRRNEDGFLYFDYNLFKDSMRPKQRGRAYIQLFESDLDTILDPANFAPDAGKGTKTFREFDIAEFRQTFLPAAELLGLTGKKTLGRMDVTNVHHIAALKGTMGIFDGLGFNSPMFKEIHGIMKQELGGLGAERANLIRLIGGTADKGSPHQLAHMFLDEALGTRGENFFTDAVLVNMNTSDNFRRSKARELAKIIADSEKIARDAQDAYKRLADAALATDFKDIQDTLGRLVTSKKLGFVKLNNVNYKPIIRETAARGGYNVRQFDELIEDIALIHKAVPTGSPKLIDELLFSPQLLKSQKTFQKLVTKIDEKFGDQGVTGAEMRRILDSFDVRMQDAGVGQTGLFEEIPDNLLEDVLNNLQAKKQSKFTKRNQKRYRQDKDLN